MDTNDVEDLQFSDVTAENGYYRAIAAIREAGIIDGYKDRTFRPNAKIECNHMAEIIANAFPLPAKNTQVLPFTDVAASYKDAITLLYEWGITTGKTATTFDGKAFVTRGQMAAFIVRAEAALAIANEEEEEQPVGIQNGKLTVQVEDYSNGQIMIDGVVYQLTGEAAKVFTEANRQALENATVVAGVNIVHLDGSITTLVIEATQVLEVGGDVDIEEVLINSLVDLLLLVTGVVGVLTVDTPEATVLLGAEILVGRVNLPEGVKPASILPNYAEVIGQITTIYIGTTPAPNPRNGSSPGGNNGGGTTVDSSLVTYRNCYVV